MIAWHIDALDPRGGIAFASERESDLLNLDPDMEAEAVRIAPPGFEPEALGGRALAFATGPGQFQLGLFVAGKELGFETLEALTEFVRRAYIASGGGDGANGIGPPGPPPPPPDEGPPPEARFRGEGGQGCADAIAGALNELGRASDEIDVELMRSTALNLAARPVKAGGPDDEDLAEAGALLIEGLVEALPVDKRQAEAWLDAVGRLNVALGRLGLTPLVRDGRRWPGLVNKLSRQLPRAPWITSRLPYGAEWVLAELFREREANHYIHHRPGDWIEEWHESLPGPSQASDPLDDLQAWPLPARLRFNKVQSLRDHLCAVVGEPLRLPAGAEVEAVTLLLFAAVHVVAHGAHSWWWPSPPLAEIVRSRVIEQGAEWLLAQLPNHAFAHEVEAVIGSAANLRSHDPPPGPRTAEA